MNQHEREVILLESGRVFNLIANVAHQFKHRNGSRLTENFFRCIHLGMDGDKFIAGEAMEWMRKVVEPLTKGEHHG